MTWLTGDLVQSIGIALATVIGAVTAWQGRRIAELQRRVAELEEQMADERGKFRSAVRVIRSMRRYIGDLCDAMSRAGLVPPPSPVEIPAELEEEI
ncbi:LapA family protein [Nocardia farcinica]|uniref:LapA family protein n=1 Tax=Nocardia farcinica TaxID=37329 RepID=UPI0037A3CAAF